MYNVKCFCLFYELYILKVIKKPFVCINIIDYLQIGQS